MWYIYVCGTYNQYFSWEVIFDLNMPDKVLFSMGLTGARTATKQALILVNNMYTQCESISFSISSMIRGYHESDPFRLGTF